MLNVSADKKDMRLLFIINTPSQAHTWHYVMQELLAKGYAIKILARDYGSTPKLLDSFGFQCSTFKPIGSQISRLATVWKTFEICYQLGRDFAPSMVIGFGVDAAVTAARFKKPCIVFIDDEHTYFQNKVTSVLADWVITPDTFAKTFGKKHVRVKGFKELAYLHPRYFQPDVTIYDQLKIKRYEPYIILRFNLIDAIHDIGIHNFAVSNQIELVKKFENYAHVFVSPEGPLPEELENNRLPTPYNRIHHVLYYSHMLVSNSCTMTTEAAVLGTPAVRIDPRVGHNDPSVFAELEQKYGLTYSFPDAGNALQKAVDLISTDGLKEQWKEKRQKLLAEKIDVAEFLSNFIERSSEGSMIKVQGVGIEDRRKAIGPA